MPPIRLAGTISRFKSMPALGRKQTLTSGHRAASRACGREQTFRTLLGVGAGVMLPHSVLARES